MKNNIGVLLPVSALPGGQGIGDFGYDCYRYLDWLSKHHYRYWQILPLNPLGEGNSPYMSICSEAIDIRYISLEMIYKDDGLLDELPEYRKGTTKVNYQAVYNFKIKWLKKAFIAYSKTGMDGLKKFKTKNPWVSEYATYLVFKKINKNKCWNEWDEKYINYFDSHNNPPKSFIKQIDFICFMQYMAFKQWKHVMAYAKAKRIKIIADMPFYVGFDSVDCWLHRDQFEIDENYNPTLVAGVPPDYFSEEGQLWGQPIYNFKKMKENNYSFIIDRISYLCSLCDILRIDHFRAFDTYYTIPFGSKNAKNGKWEVGPRNDLFDTLYHKYPKIDLIAEDLGDLFQSVYDLRDNYNLPGMFVTQFLICDYHYWSNNNLILYTGTHDNQTFYSWFKSLNEYQKLIIQDRIQSNGKELYKDLMNAIYNMPSKITIFPMQDLLKLDDKARFNEPGTMSDKNWSWKLKDFSFIDEVKFFK